MNYRLVLHVSILLLATSLFAAQEKPADVSPLTPGKTIDRQINGGQTQSFTVILQTGQLLRAVTTSRDIDVVATLYGPDGQKLLTVDLLKYPAPEPISFAAEQTADYKLEVRADGTAVVQGRYQLVSEVKSLAQESDRERLTAERLLLQANDLEREGTPESLQKSIDKRAEALVLWRKLADKYWEAYSLHYSGRASGTLNRNQEALSFYNQALALRREIGDRFGEAGTLNNLGLIYAGLQDKTKAVDLYNQALAISRSLNDPIGETRTLNNLGSFFDGIGERPKALEFYNQVLTLKQSVGDKDGEADALIIIGNLYYS